MTTEDHVKGFGGRLPRCKAGRIDLAFQHLQRRKPIQPPALGPVIVDRNRRPNVVFKGIQTLGIGGDNLPLVDGFLVGPVAADPARQALEDAFQHVEKALNCPL